MKIPVRFFTIIGIVVILALSAWSGVMAARGLNGGSNSSRVFSGIFLNSIQLSDTTSTAVVTDTPGSGTTVATDTPVAVSGTPSGSEDCEEQQFGTPAPGVTPTVCGSSEGEDQQFGTPAATETPEVEQDNQGEDNQNGTPSAIGTPSGEDDQGEDGQFGTPFVVGTPGTPTWNHDKGGDGGSGGSGGTGGSGSGGGGDDGGGDQVLSTFWATR